MLRESRSRGLRGRGSCRLVSCCEVCCGGRFLRSGIGKEEKIGAKEAGWWGHGVEGHLKGFFSLSFFFGQACLIRFFEKHPWEQRGIGPSGMGDWLGVRNTTEMGQQEGADAVGRWSFYFRRISACPRQQLTQTLVVAAALDSKYKMRFPLPRFGGFLLPCRAYFAAVEVGSRHCRISQHSRCSTGPGPAAYMRDSLLSLLSPLSSSTSLSNSNFSIPSSIHHVPQIRNTLASSFQLSTPGSTTSEGRVAMSSHRRLLLLLVSSTFFRSTHRTHCLLLLARPTHSLTPRNRHAPQPTQPSKPSKPAQRHSTDQHLAELQESTSSHEPATLPPAWPSASAQFLPPASCPGMYYAPARYVIGVRSRYIAHPVACLSFNLKRFRFHHPVARRIAELRDIQSLYKSTKGRSRTSVLFPGHYVLLRGSVAELCFQSGRHTQTRAPYIGKEGKASHGTRSKLERDLVESESVRTSRQTKVRPRHEHSDDDRDVGMSSISQRPLRG
ncbi:hypothetical protein BDY21DRAFT_37487 [Lineolata rhizophorae]|uniref:Uncharacterized protein n=1 Tax=Lineolata rhizophorae TaxID=578093 RepID=A0A6A6NZQ5_9PEZI|nr:hypothetical protein BDY21DRAFT_37487 [Lineolata rhizophorae]